MQKWMNFNIYAMGSTASFRKCIWEGGDLIYINLNISEVHIAMLPFRMKSRGSPGKFRYKDLIAPQGSRVLAWCCDVYEYYIGYSNLLITLFIDRNSMYIDMVSHNGFYIWFETLQRCTCSSNQYYCIHTTGTGNSWRTVQLGYTCEWIVWTDVSVYRPLE